MKHAAQLTPSVIEASPVEPIPGDATITDNAEIQETHVLRFLTVIKSAVVASARGVAPPTAVEFGRKMVFTDERPSFNELDKALQSMVGA